MSRVKFLFIDKINRAFRIGMKTNRKINKIEFIIALFKKIQFNFKFKNTQWVTCMILEKYIILKELNIS
jgi:hypothetical protein